MLNIFYQIITFGLSLFLLPLFYLVPRGRFLLQQRYGYWNYSQQPFITGEKIIWLHAASYGEVNAVIPVIRLLKQKYAGHQILVTTTSDTGYKKAAEIADYVRLCPFDNCIWYKNALKNIHPEILIVTETEIWPAMINFAARNNIPAYLINARISDYSLPYYKLFRKFTAPLLRSFKHISVINQESKNRLLMLGAAESKISTGGYSKYDIEPEVSSENDARQLKKNYFLNTDPVITLGSIRPGEEEIWFKALNQAKDENLKFNLVIAPRHLEKVGFFEDKLSQYKINFIKYSELHAPAERTLLLDVMGKLSQVYSFTDLAFIGASLVNIGGHNPLEPACYRSAICIGPYYNTVREIVEKLSNENAISMVTDAESAYRLIKAVCNKDQQIIDTAEKAHTFWRGNYGSSNKIVQLLEIN